MKKVSSLLVLVTWVAMVVGPMLRTMTTANILNRVNNNAILSWTMPFIGGKKRTTKGCKKQNSWHNNSTYRGRGRGRDRHQRKSSNKSPKKSTVPPQTSNTRK